MWKPPYDYGQEIWNKHKSNIKKNLMKERYYVMMVLFDYRTKPYIIKKYRLLKWCANGKWYKINKNNWGETNIKRTVLNELNK